MRARQTISELVSFAARGPGTDAERRSALWLAGELRQAGFDARIETFWCRPNWALAHFWHVLLALAGSLLSVPFPRVGFVLLAVALASIVADELLGRSLGRWLTPERASQNVVATQDGKLAAAADGQPPRPRLLIVSNYDAGRTGLIHSPAVQWLRALLRRPTGGLAPGWLGSLALAVIWLMVTVVIRDRDGSTPLAATLQLVPTAALVLAVALLLEAAGAGYGPAAGDNASGAALALALVRALRSAPPRAVEVELVLCGAHEGGSVGLRRHLHQHRHVLGQARAIVLGLAASGQGMPRWWRSDGPLLPRRHSQAAAGLCAQVATQAPHLQARAHRGRGRTPALAPRHGWLNTIAIGALDERGQAPRSHQPSDLPEAVDPQALDRMLEFALLLVDAIDAHVARLRSQPATPAPARAATPA